MSWLCDGRDGGGGCSDEGEGVHVDGGGTPGAHLVYARTQACRTNTYRVGGRNKEAAVVSLAQARCVMRVCSVMRVCTTCTMSCMHTQHVLYHVSTCMCAPCLYTYSFIAPSPHTL